MASNGSSAERERQEKALLVQDRRARRAAVGAVWLHTEIEITPASARASGVCPESCGFKMIKATWYPSPFCPTLQNYYGPSAASKMSYQALALIFSYCVFSAKLKALVVICRVAFSRSSKKVPARQCDLNVSKPVCFLSEWGSRQLTWRFNFKITRGEISGCIWKMEIFFIAIMS